MAFCLPKIHPEDTVFTVLLCLHPGQHPESRVHLQRKLDTNPFFQVSYALYKVFWIQRNVQIVCLRKELCLSAERKTPDHPWETELNWNWNAQIISRIDFWVVAHRAFLMQRVVQFELDFAWNLPRQRKFWKNSCGDVFLEVIIPQERLQNQSTWNQHIYWTCSDQSDNSESSFHFVIM